MKKLTVTVLIFKTRKQIWIFNYLARFSLSVTWGFGTVAVRISMKLTGSAAKNIAAMIYAVLKNRDKNKTKGRQRLTAMLKSGKELKVFTVSEEHLKQFAAEVNRYGVVYCALRGKEKSADDMVDIMVRAEDASKINRIVERFKDKKKLLSFLDEIIGNVSEEELQRYRKSVHHL